MIASTLNKLCQCFKEIGPSSHTHLSSVSYCSIVRSLASTRWASTSGGTTTAFVIWALIAVLLAAGYVGFYRLVHICLDVSHTSSMSPSSATTNRQIVYHMQHSSACANHVPNWFQTSVQDLEWKTNASNSSNVLSSQNLFGTSDCVSPIDRSNAIFEYQPWDVRNTCRNSARLFVHVCALFESLLR